MSCKENFSMFDHFIQNQTPIPMTPLPDQMKQIIKIEKQHSDKSVDFDVLLNKFVNNLQITDVQLQQLSEQQRIVLQHMKKKAETKSKRPDQCQKLFYKKAFKFAESQFFKKKKCKSRKMSQFYHNYFDKTSKRYNLPITSFYHPDKKTKPGLQVGFRTFNITYIRLILKSSQFREVIKVYHKFFLDQCLKERKKKLSSFSGSIKKIMERSRENYKVLTEYLQSGQCKIPWTLDQMKEAQHIAYEELQKIEINEPSEEVKIKKGPDIEQNFSIIEEDAENFYSESESQELFEKLLRE